MSELTQLKPFHTDKSKKWLEGKESFARSQTTARLSRQSSEVRVSPVIYAMCSEVENIYKSLAFSQKGYRKTNYNTLKMWEEHFSANMNVLQRGLFLNKSIQKQRKNMEFLFKVAFCKGVNCNTVNCNTISLNKSVSLQLQKMVRSKVYIQSYCWCGNANCYRVVCKSFKVGKDEHKKQESLPQLPICSCMRYDNHQASNFLRQKCVGSVEKNTEQLEFV